MVYTAHQLFYFPYHIFFLIVTTEIIQAYNNIMFTFFVVPTFNVFSKHSYHLPTLVLCNVVGSLVYAVLRSMK